MKLSSLPKTWIFDLDGTLVEHNGYLKERDQLLPGVKEFFKSIKDNDLVIILTARKDEYKDSTIEFLKKEGIKFDEIIFDVPYGERILINDMKPSGLKTAYSINLKRNFGINIKIEEDEAL